MDEQELRGIRESITALQTRLQHAATEGRLAAARSSHEIAKGRLRTALLAAREAGRDDETTVTALPVEDLRLKLSRAAAEFDLLAKMANAAAFLDSAAEEVLQARGAAQDIARAIAGQETFAADLAAAMEAARNA